MRNRPGDPLTSLRLEPLRMPATDCLHLFKPLAAGQLRGITWLAPVLLRLHELDQFEDAALVKAKVAALFTGFITDPDGSAGGLTGTNANGALTVGMEPRQSDPPTSWHRHPVFQPDRERRLRALRQEPPPRRRRWDGPTPTNWSRAIWRVSPIPRSALG